MIKRINMIIMTQSIGDAPMTQQSPLCLTVIMDTGKVINQRVEGNHVQHSHTLKMDRHLM